MAIITADEYRERIARLTPRLFMGGKKIERLTEHPVTKGVIDATARVYELTMDPQYAEIELKLKNALHIWLKDTRAVENY